jgi:hypothetical protein
MLGLMRFGALNTGAQRFAVLAVTAFLLSACSAEDGAKGERSAAADPPSVESKPSGLDPDRFAAFARARRIDTESQFTRANAENSFVEREALVAGMLASQTIDIGALDAEVSEFRSELIVRKYFARFMEDKLSDAQLRVYFAEHGEEFLPFRARIAKIEVKKLPGTASAEREYQRIADIEKQLADGASFGDVAANNSDDRPTASRGGEVGWIESTQLPTQVEVAVRGMRAGEVSRPIAIKNGVVLVKLLADVQLSNVPFESVMDEVRARVRYSEQKKETTRLLASSGYVRAVDDEQMISQATVSQE